MSVPGPRPNILFVLSDQLRRDALGCYGDPDARTPHLDAMAAQGVRFDAACSTYPVCVPYRFTLMTGHYAHSRQVPAIFWRLSPSERTLADAFNDAGYQTAYIGKWHLGGGLGTRVMKTPVPRDLQGRWQTFAGFELRNNYFDNVYFENDDPTPIPIAGYQTDGLFDRLDHFLSHQRRDDRPFAAVLSVEAPHPRFEAPPDLEAQWRQREIRLPPNYLADDPAAARAFEACAAPPRSPDPQRVLRHRKTYYAMVENLDQNVGRMMRRLGELGLERDTIVVFTADHGELGGSHNLTDKQFPYEESVGTPLIVCGAACGVATGRRVAAPTCTEDLFPTLLDLAGVAADASLPGRSLAPLIRGEAESLDRDGVMLQFVGEMRANLPFYERPWRAMRSERYKYTVIGGQATGLQPWQLFDLGEDPYELHDLIDDPAYRAVAADLHARLARRMHETGDDAWLAAAWGQPDQNRSPVLPHEHEE